MRGGKVALRLRREGALKRLEASYEAFKAAGVAKPAWTTTRNGGKHHITHSGKTFDEECARMKKEIDILREKLILLKLTLFNRKFLEFPIKNIIFNYIACESSIVFKNQINKRCLDGEIGIHEGD